MAKFTKGQWVWLTPKHNSGIATGGQVTQVGNKTVTVIDDDGKKHDVLDLRRLSPMDQSSVDGVEDMIMLGDLNEAAVLRNLERRFKDKAIYTYTGAILVAVNPYQVLPIYTAQEIEQYRGKKFGELPPHVFAIADNAFSNMKRFNHNQCILISGESGAGKTETTKLLLQFLAAVSGQHSWIEQQIIESNPVLEAFGNAKTVRNNNSSRFGKYINITFDEQGCIQGAQVQQYLLEKSRIVSQQSDERNYHIFYCMLLGMTAEERKLLNLGTLKDYRYLSQGAGLKLQDRDDVQDFGNIKSAMEVLNFTEEERWAIFKLLAALLHLGNLKYKGTRVNHTDATVIENRDSLRHLAEELLISEGQLVSALTTKTILTREGSITQNLDKQAALDVRDAFVKALYGRLFDWIVQKINRTIDKSGTSQDPKAKSIGLLDIFGFECFTHNSFEQLCINFANENLQQFFVQHVFHLEQMTYKTEGIAWTSLTYTDNTSTLDLLVTQKLSLFNLVDEESRFPKGTDKTLLTKLHVNHESNPLYVRPKAEANLEFGVKHYAGRVMYSTRGFLEKNRDTFSRDLLEMIKSSKSSFLVELFEKDAQESGQVRTLGSQFRQSLQSLMDTLGSCQPFFVRCIKPNANKSPKVFDRDLCLRQIQYSGLMETIHIRRNGYPVQQTFAEFIDRYRHISKSVQPSHCEENLKEAAMKICKEVLESDDYQLGNSKVFLKDGQDAYLEQLRDRHLISKIVFIQRILRGFVQRSNTAKLMEEKREEIERMRRQRVFELEDCSEVERENVRRKSSVFVMSPQRRRESYLPVSPPTLSQIKEPDLPNRSSPALEPKAVRFPQYQPVFHYDWQHTGRLMVQPLLEKTKRSQTLSQLACQCFETILKYIGDLPHKSKTVTELTDILFEPPINYEILRDEVYCQVLMQLNGNSNETSLLRAWQLMWLMTGLFAPSEKLQHETRLYLEIQAQDGGKHRQVAGTCKGRLQNTLSHGSCRKYPPHEAEVKAIQKKVTRLLYNIYFPDDTCAQVEVDSSSRAKDVITAIATELKLKTSNGFSLFLKVGDRVVSILDGSFVFDVGRQWVTNLQTQGTVHDGGKMMLIFLKKLWTHTEPGKDRVADVKFHYPQELPKYLSGYHKCSKEDVLQLAALILKAKYGNSAKTHAISSIMKELGPSQMVNKNNPGDWQKAVTKIYASLRHRSTDDAKMMFLKVMERWKTFGSAFFTVRQLSHARHPPNVLLAVSPSGVLIIHPISKDILESYSFADILVWSCDAKSFHMTTGNVMNSSKFFCQTSLGYKIDDLLTSYKSVAVDRKKDYTRTLRRDSIYPSPQTVNSQQEYTDKEGLSTDL